MTRLRAVSCSKPGSWGTTCVPDNTSASTGGSRGRCRCTGWWRPTGAPGPYVAYLGGNTGQTGIATPVGPLAGSHNHIGASVRLGRSSWLVRPALRAGIQSDGSDYVEPTAGASLTFGRRYGARFILHVSEEEVRFQMGGYVSF